MVGDQWTRVLQSAHNAMTDCKVLEGLVAALQKTREEIISKTTPLPVFFEHRLRLQRKKLLSPSLQIMKSHKVSAALCGRMAEAGITMEELQTAYSQNKRIGLEVCLQVQSADGKPRVQIKKKDLDKIEEYFKESDMSNKENCSN